MADVASLVFDIDSTQAAGAARELLKLESAAGRAATGAAKLETTYRGADGRFKSAASAARDNAREIESLASKYNTGMAAQLAYARAQGEVAQAVRLGVVAADQQDAVLERLAVQYGVTAGAATKLGGAMNNVGGNAANVFSQFNDIGVMLAAGQNPIQLALQQGTQLNQVWVGMGKEGRTVAGVAGVMRGAFASMLSPMSLLTLGVIAGGAALIQWAMSSDTSKEAAQDFATSLDALQSATTNINTASKMLALDGLTQVYEAYGAINEQVVRNVQLLTEAAIYKEMEAIRISAAALREEMTGGWLTSDVDDVRILFGTTNDQARVLLNTIESIRSAKTFEEQATQAKVLRDMLLSGGKTLDDFQGAARAAVIQVIELADGSERLAVQVEKSKQMGEQFANLDLAGGVIAAGNAALVLANNLNISLATAQRLAAMGPQGQGETPAGGRGDPRTMGGSFTDWNTRDVDAFNKAWEEEQKLLKKKSQARASGAAAELKAAEKGFQTIRELLEKESMFQIAEWEKRQAQLDAAYAKRLLSEENYHIMKQQLQMMYFGIEAEQNLLRYQMDQESLQAAFDQKLLTEQQYLMKRAELQHQYYSEAIGVDQNGTAQRLSQMSADFAQMNSLAGGGYDSLLRLQKTFAAGSALINAYLAASQALADPTISTWAKFAAYAKVLAAGIGLVNAIKGTSASSSGKSSATASAAKAEPTRNILVRLEGPDFMVDMAESIMQQIYEQSKDGRVIISRDVS